jgi:hypothetical protein
VVRPTAIASVGIFVIAFWTAGVAKVAADALTITAHALSIMCDKDLDDDAQEKGIRRDAIKMCGALFSIVTRSILALLASFIPIWLADVAGLAQVSDILTFMSQWDVILTFSVLVVVSYVLLHRSKPDSAKEYQVNYSGADRLLYGTSFFSPAVGFTAADIGHFEFGELRRPIRFPGLQELIAGSTPLTIDYWSAYRIAAIEHVFERREGLIVISHEHTVTHGHSALKEVCRRLEIPDAGMLDEAVSIFKLPSQQPTDDTVVNADMPIKAERPYELLVQWA